MAYVIKDLSTEQFPVSAYVGSSKYQKDLKERKPTLLQVSSGAGGGENWGRNSHLKNRRVGNIIKLASLAFRRLSFWGF